jgi:hypothetical protein
MASPSGAVTPATGADAGKASAATRHVLAQSSVDRARLAKAFRRFLRASARLRLRFTEGFS